MWISEKAIEVADVKTEKDLKCESVEINFSSFFVVFFYFISYFFFVCFLFINVVWVEWSSHFISM